MWEVWKWDYKEFVSLAKSSIHFFSGTITRYGENGEEIEQFFIKTNKEMMLWFMQQSLIWFVYWNIFTWKSIVSLFLKSIAKRWYVL